MRRIASVALVLASAMLSACAPAGPDVSLPPAGGAPDYQLGGAYDPAPGVDIVARDRTAPPAEGAYSICYVNGFQTQPGELADWPAELLLRDDAEIVFDPNWPDEALLDTSTAPKRDAILTIVADWIEGCAHDGYDAVEFDNLDTYARSDGRLTFADNLDLAARLVEVAHSHGLAAGQKNATEDAAELQERAGFDFAITEECAAFDECGAYTSVYGEHVIDVEYTDAGERSFRAVCEDSATPASVVLRDRGLTVPASVDYVFSLC